MPALGSEDAFVTIAAGESIAVNHTVATSYDFEAVGPGTFTFEVITNLQVSEGDEITHFALDAASVDVEVTDDVTKRTVFPDGSSSRTSTPVCDDGNRRQYMADALTEARAVAGGAAHNIRQDPWSGNYNDYFNHANHDEVWWNFDRIAGDLPSSGNRGCVLLHLAFDRWLF